MKLENLHKVYNSVLPANLARDLVGEFVQIRQDLATATLGRSSPGKFVETVVQCLQYLDTGKYEKKPSVDVYLRSCDSKRSSLDDGLRICAARLARSMYAIRSKRNMMHKGDVDPNGYDLRFLFGGAQWIMAELLRNCTGIPMKEAGRLIRILQEPFDEMVEDFRERRVVLAHLTIPEEILVLLHSGYPDSLTLKAVQSALDRWDAGSVKNSCRTLWKNKLIEGTPRDGYMLTRTGYRRAIKVVAAHLEAD